jgi:hypothetical protein
VYRAYSTIPTGSTVKPVGVLDTDGLLGLFSQLAGRRLLGVVDGCGCLELVFDDPDRVGGNLVSIFTDAGRHTGLVALGFVADPEAYVIDWPAAA